MTCACIDNVETYPWDSEDPFALYEENLFAIYKKMYEESLFNYHKTPITMKHYPPDYGKKSGFYHLIYQNYDSTGHDIDRLPNLERMKKVTWGRSIIDFNNSAKCGRLLIYKNKRKREENICIFSECLDFLVILTIRKDYLLLKTAYPIEYENSRNDIYKEYRDFKENVHKN
jgi:hypothetical protein